MERKTEKQNFLINKTAILIMLMLMGIIISNKTDEIDFLVKIPEAGAATIYYVGAFSGSNPSDNSSCGTKSNPCSTLSYWNTNRRTILSSGDVVRIAPGTYSEGSSCFLLDQYAKGVTYEGRTAADGVLDDHESVVVQGGCGGNGITPSNRGACYSSSWGGSNDYSGFILRDVKLQNITGDGMYICGGPNAITQNVTFDRIRIDRSSGMWIGSWSNSYDDIDCRGAGRWVKNITIKDSELNGPSYRFPGALTLGCADGITIERTKIHDTSERADASCKGEYLEAGCDDHDGITGVGAINVVIRDSEVYNAGEDGIDIGGHPNGKSHHWLIERTAAYNNPAGNFKASGGRYITIINSYSWGKGSGYHQYSGSHHIYLYNNTFWNDHEAAFFWNYETESEFYNNIFVSTNGVETVWIDKATTNTTNKWRNNIVANTKPQGHAITETDGYTRYDPTCQIEANSFEPPPLPCNLGPSASPASLDDTPAGLAQFQASGNAGQWFGAGTGKNDKWGALPSVVNPNSPSVANLHLLATDTIARDNGETLASFNTDSDNQIRPAGAGWDIGADEVGGGASSIPTPTPTSSGLRGDLNKDGIVNSLDWSIMNSKWFTSDATADLNSDGIINSLDFSIMNGNWLKTG